MRRQAIATPLVIDAVSERSVSAPRPLDQEYVASSVYPFPGDRSITSSASPGPTTFRGQSCQPFDAAVDSIFGRKTHLAPMRIRTLDIDAYKDDFHYPKDLGGILRKGSCI